MSAPQVVAFIWAVGLVALVVLVWLERRDRVVRISVQAVRPFRTPASAGKGRTTWRATMWQPVDQINVGDVCSLKVIGRKKSGALVPLAPDKYNAGDGAFAEVIGDQVTGVAEGVANIVVSLVADPSIIGQVALAVADPIVSLDVSAGNDDGLDAAPA